MPTAIQIRPRTEDELRCLRNAAEFLRGEAEITLTELGDGYGCAESLECVASAFAAFTRLLREVEAGGEPAPGQRRPMGRVGRRVAAR